MKNLYIRFFYALFKGWSQKNSVIDLGYGMLKEFEIKLQTTLTKLMQDNRVRGSKYNLHEILD